jgi:MYXO-CTERM domain-containing protein
MTLRSLPRTWLSAAIASGLLGAPGVAAAAEAPSGANFDIWYYKTDENGKRQNSRLFSSSDLTRYVNRARCECGQDISVRMVLKRAMTNYDNSVRVTTFVGARCDQGQTGINQQVDPCVKVLSSSPSAYTLGVNFAFEPIWLAGGTERSGSQDLVDATPAGSCDVGEGDAGVWICIENMMQPDCQPDEFQVQGTQNKNSAMGMMQAIRYDFLPPTVLPTSFSIDEGDGAVVISWDQDASGDGGFRILCADADGNPLPGKGIDDPPSLTSVNQGTLYFTKGNLCPDGEFADPMNDLPDDPSTDGGSLDAGTGGGTDGGTGFGTSVGVVDALELDFDGVFGGTGLTTSGTSDGGSTDGGSTDGGSTSRGSSDGGTATGGSGSTGGTELPSSGIQSLDWDYVCTGHIAGNARSARIEGLDNGRTYQFLVVAYDPAGNPAASPDILTATPRETIDLWEQCELQGEVCGEGGFCNCTAEPRGRDGLGLLALGGIGLVGWARRRRRG